MAFFIKCVNPNYLVNALYVIKNGKPHKLADPRSVDRDWFKTSRDAAAAKRKVERMFKAAAPSTKFRIERS